MKFVKFPFKVEKQYRLPGYDYSGGGYYFVTICMQDRLNILRCVGTDPRVRSSYKKQPCGLLSEFGNLCQQWWLKIPDKFPGTELDKFCFMPNHFHGILIIRYKCKAQTRGSAPTNYTGGSAPTNYTGGSAPTNHTGWSAPTNHTGWSAPTVGNVIQWFKTMTTNEYIRNVKTQSWPKFSKHVWQPRFHDRVIRNEKEYWAIKRYILDNPKNWDKDKENIMK